MYFAAALAACSLLFLPACTRLAVDGGRKTKAIIHTITFSVNGGNCQQSDSVAVAGAATVVDVNWGDTVNFTAGLGHTYALTFVAPNVSCASPFQGGGACQLNFNSAAITNGLSGNETYSYGSLSIDGAPCNLNPGGGPGPMGMRMRP